ncbi:MAG: acetate uptake transporter [Solirubrobacteraceae bacterium]
MEASGVTSSGGGAQAIPQPAAAPALSPPGWTAADPGPLGLAAFALTTFVLSMYNAELVGKAGEPIVLGLALMYGGIVQVLAGMWEFRRGNTFGAVAFSSYGGFWLSFWAFVQFYAPEIKDANALSKAVGLFLIGWGIFTLYMFAASFSRSGAIQLVFLLLTVTFFLLGIGNADMNKDLVKFGGYFGLATAAAAWYTSFAEVMFAAYGRWVLPVRPPRERTRAVR